MNIEDLRAYCLSKPYVSEHLPFDDYTLVFKIGELKVFALASLKEANAVNLKCDPDYAVSLREEFIGISPGYHMNKKHWNTITFNEDVSDEKIKHLVNHSYELVYKKLTKKQKLQFPI